MTASTNVMAISLYDIRTNGFVNLHLSKSDTQLKNLENVSNDADFNNYFSSGFSFFKQLDQDWSTQLQLLANSENNEFDLEVDIAQASYRLSSHVNLKAGRLRAPTWLVSDYINTEKLLVWATPPNEVYRFLPFQSINGLLVNFYNSLFNDMLLLEVDFYTGQSSVNAVIGSSTLSGTIDDIVGTSVRIGFENTKLNISYLQGSPELDLVAGGVTVANFDLGRATFYSIGLESEYKNLFVISEYVTEKSDNDLVRDVQAYYTSLGYRFGKLVPHVTYSRSTKNSSSYISGGSKTLSSGLNYSFNDYVTVKFEHSKVKSEGEVSSFGIYTRYQGVTSSTKPNRPINFYNLAINLVF